MKQRSPIPWPAGQADRGPAVNLVHRHWLDTGPAQPGQGAPCAGTEGQLLGLVDPAACVPIAGTHIGASYNTVIAFKGHSKDHGDNGWDCRANACGSTPARLIGAEGRRRIFGVSVATAATHRAVIGHRALTPAATASNTTQRLPILKMDDGDTRVKHARLR